MDQDVIWEGKIGSIPLKVQMPHAGKIFAEWQSEHGSRSKFCKSVQEFENTVLYQMALSTGPEGTAAVREVLESVVAAEADRPAPPPRQEPRPKRKNPKARQHRRSRRPPRRY